MAYIDSEYKSYHDAAETFITNAHETLQNLAVVKALGTHAEALLEYADSLFIPNIRHGEVQYKDSEEYDNGTPLIILPYGEEYKLHPNYLGISQKTRTRIHEYVNRAYTGAKASTIERVIDNVDTFVRTKNNTLSIGQTSHAEVSRNFNMIYIGKKDSTIPIPYISRSIMTVSPYAAEKSHLGLLFVHEGTHLTQIDTQPLSLPLRTTRKRFLYAAQLEIEAYQRESSAITALYPDNTPDERNIIADSYAPYINEALKGETILTRTELIKRLHAINDASKPERVDRVAA